MGTGTVFLSEVNGLGGRGGFAAAAADGTKTAAIGIGEIAKSRQLGRSLALTIMQLTEGFLRYEAVRLHHIPTRTDSDRIEVANGMFCQAPLQAPAPRTSR